MKSIDKQSDFPIVEIDEHHLDRECIRLPHDYLKAAHRAAEAERDVEEHKRALDVVCADGAQSIRSDPAKYGLEKITESAIKELVQSSQEYQTTLRRLHTAEHEARLAKALVAAMGHKKSALTMLVELHGMAYFANPKVSERGSEAVKNMTRNRIRQRMGRDE